MATWADIQKQIFATESGGDYNALYGYQNRPGGLFEDVRITDMTVDDALDFANPKGRYGAFVDTQVGRVATPMGAYQIVGSTLRDAKRGLGLKGDEQMTPALQDKIGKWIYENQGAGAWEGLKGKGAMDGKPTGILGAMAGQQEEETPFYKRDSFKDMIGNLAIGLNSMRLNPDQNLPRVIQAQQAQRKQERETNRTLAWMRANGYGQYADMIEAGKLDPKAVLGSIMAQQLKGNKPSAAMQGVMERMSLAGIDPNSPEGKEFLATGGKSYEAQVTAQAKSDVAFREGAQARLDGANSTLKVLNDALDPSNRDALQAFVGPIDAMTPDVFGPAKKFRAIHNQLTGKAFLAAYEQLRGAGAITGAEGEKAQAALARLDRSQSEEDYIAALEEFRDIVTAGKNRLVSRMKGLGMDVGNADALSTEAPIMKTQSGYTYRVKP